MPRTSVAGPTPVPVSAEENLTDVVWERGRGSSGSSSREILRWHEDGAWRGMTWSQLADRVRAVAAGLLDLGVQKGDRVAIMAPTRVEWTVADLAILAVGGVSVPIYETDSPEQCAWILSDAGVAHAIAGSAVHAKNLDLARKDAPDLGEILILDDGALDALAERGTEQLRAQVEDRARSVGGDDLATIIYTSGTTGNPKGCLTTHRNWLWIARQSDGDLKKMVGPEDSTLLFLPVAHSFGRLIQFLCLQSDVQLGFARSLETLSEDLQSFSPTFLLAVPRVFEKVYNGAQRKAGGGLKGRIFAAAASTATAWSTATDAGRSPSPVVNLQHGLMDKLVYSKLRHGLGGRVRYCISGGAPLAPHLAHFFSAAGVTILEGYGLTETCAPSTVNKPDDLRIGTVGKPLQGVEIRIAEDGEILIKGGNVFQGYHRNEAATREVLDDDGWFRSGDIGEIDDDGFLRITGRKKELIVTAGGKNVAPAVLEERLKAHRLVSQAMVVGDNKPFIGAIITLDEEEAKAFAAEHGLDGANLAALADAPAIRTELEKAVQHANDAVSRAESIRKWKVLDRDFSIEHKEMTPSLKIRRKVIAENFADAIDWIYAGT